MTRGHTGDSTILVTGGAGFIGSALIRYLIKETEHNVVNVDKLTYAGNTESLIEVSGNSRYTFEQVDICDFEALSCVVQTYRPRMIMHLAAESHVDRSIDGPSDFISTNILGTYNLLEVIRSYWPKMSSHERSLFRFHHISTDEVYGDLADSEQLFVEDTPYSPSSPYSASKASSDHLVRAWGKTFGLPVLITNCSNNYGPFHFPEKLIPLMIINAIEGNPLPVYGNGKQVRDWLYVDDHVEALYIVVSEGVVGETYNIGGHNEKQNIEVVEGICDLLDELAPQHRKGMKSYNELIDFVEDRPGHDLRYAICADKIKNHLGWVPNETFETGLRKTVVWYLENRRWWKAAQMRSNEGMRLGSLTEHDR